MTMCKQWWLAIGFALVWPLAAHAVPPAQRLQQMVDYLGVDYAGAVRNGEVVDASEYEEMQEFTVTMGALAEQLADTPARPEIRKGVAQLKRLVAEKADPAQVARQASVLRQLLIRHYDLAAVPRRAPDLARGAALYAQWCAGCHGVEGRGDGPQAVGLEPAPTDFTDLARYRQRTLQGLYTTITQGVEGTAMPAWAKLPEVDRWSLAFHVGRLAPAAAGLGRDVIRAPALSLQAFTTRTPVELAARLGPRGAAQVAWLREHPETLFKGAEAALAHARQALNEALAAYEAGRAREAHDHAVDAYLEGFELVEGNLDAVDPGLRHEIEAAMTGLRNGMRQGWPVERVAQQVNALQQSIDRAGALLSETRLSPATAFTSALVILLREGLEAILVVAALAAFLIRTGRRDGLRYLALGTGAALLLGLATWMVSVHLVRIGGADRELTEGLAALLAAVLLFYVGFWLHSKTGAAQWKTFIEGSVQKALGRGALWGLAGLAFIAVYREVFETVLFYQALWLQTGAPARGMLLTGVAVAAGALVVLAVLILRFSTRLPLRRFFAVTSFFMFVLAVVFAGKGVAALQEAGRLPLNLLEVPLLGIRSNLEALGVQMALVVLALVLVWHSHRRNRRLQAA